MAVFPDKPMNPALEPASFRFRFWPIHWNPKVWFPHYIPTTSPFYILIYRGFPPKKPPFTGPSPIFYTIFSIWTTFLATPGTRECDQIQSKGSGKSKLFSTFLVVAVYPMRVQSINPGANTIPQKNEYLLYS